MKTFALSFVNGGASKFLVAVIGGVMVTVVAGHTDWKTIASAAITAGAVYLFPNSNKTPPATP